MSTQLHESIGYSISRNINKLINDNHRSIALLGGHEEVPRMRIGVEKAMLQPGFIAG